MSNEKRETVTIEVPLGTAKRLTIECLRNLGQDGVFIERACRAALEARRTKLERFMDSTGDFCVSWVESGGHPRQYYCRAFPVPWERSILTDCSATEDQARLMAAAPKLLEVAIYTHRNGKHLAHMTASERKQIKDAIRAALPEDVAAEVLGE